MLENELLNELKRPVINASSIYFHDLFYDIKYIHDGPLVILSIYNFKLVIGNKMSMD